MKPKKSLTGRLQKLVLATLIPMVILIISALTAFIICNYQYQTESRNIILASNFSQDFKNDIDLKMYYYATGSEYATGVPISDVDDALRLAQDLKQGTNNKDSLRAINSVIDLCENLKDKIWQIEKTESYDERLEQLDTNVYILTDLIQNYMSAYMHFEAVEMAALQKNMDMALTAEISVVIVVALLLISFAIINSIQISRSITRPIDDLYNRVTEIGEGELVPKEPVDADDEKLQALSDSFEEMIGRLAQQVELNRKEQQKIREMELMLLQAQINPHFLYNTLDTIIWLVECGKNEQAVDMVSSLSNFFRTSLSKGRDAITLREEELHVRSYLEIQQVRYKDILTYDIQVEESIGDIIVPKLTLQPIVENALYHGIKLKRGVGNIEIRATKKEKIICLSVRDTGIGMDEEELMRVRESLKSEKGVGFGMSAVYKRLKLMYNERCEFRIESTKGVGTCVTIYLPDDRSKNEPEQYTIV